MELEILGPNLPGYLQDRGALHVHRAGCADIARSYRGADERDHPWRTSAATIREVVFEIYGDHFTDYGFTADDAAIALDGGINPEKNGETPLGLYHVYEADIYFAPCVKELK